MNVGFLLVATHCAAGFVFGWGSFFVCFDSIGYFEGKKFGVGWDGMFWDVGEGIPGFQFVELGVVRQFPQGRFGEVECLLS